jgi:hypothetical protein
MKLFKVNELSGEIYHAAASKLTKKGGIHKDRADAIRDWASRKRLESMITKYKEVGLFSVNVDISSPIVIVSAGNKPDKKEFQLTLLGSQEFWKRKQSAKSLDVIKNGPIDCYIASIEFFTEFPEDEFMPMLEDNYLIFTVSIVSEELLEKYATNIFSMNVPISWSNNVFKIDEDKEVDISFGFNESESKILFSDRKSAFKFKSKILVNLNKYLTESTKTYLRETFMRLSDSTEYTKLFEKINTIKVNSLYI